MYPNELASAGLSYARISSIPGWLSLVDFSLFRFILSTQDSEDPPGDLAELGVYEGKSAVVIGDHLRAGESFTVVDLFEDGRLTDSDNERENLREYQDLSRSKFESNYLAVHAELPCVLQGQSSMIGAVASHDAHRFVHIDASHLYDHVKVDIQVAADLLRQDGVVVLDDYRAAHTPGVAAAAWAAVANGLRPFLLTDGKMYATWGDNERWIGALASWVAGSSLEHEIQEISGHTVYRLWAPRPALARWVPPGAVPFVRGLHSRLSRG